MKSTPLPGLFALGSSFVPCLLLHLAVSTSAWGQYRPPDQRTVYDDWTREIEDRRSSGFHEYKPAPTPKFDPGAYARASFFEEQKRISDAYNAKVARENARIDQLNARYDRRRQLVELLQAGNVPAMRDYGLDLLNDPDSTTSARQTGVAWLRYAADRGDAQSRQYFALQAAEQAARVAERAAEAKRAEAAAEAAKIAQLTTEANAGDLQAMTTLGTRLFYRKSVEDKRLGLAWMTKAAKLNDRFALEFMEGETAREVGTPKELAEALDYRVRRARIPNEPKAALEVGTFYLRGKFGAPIDRALALPFLEKAAAEGNPEARFRIAEAFARGVGGPVDAPEAIKRYREALAQKKSEAYERTDARLALSLLLLAPENDPPSHAPELLALWDQGARDWGDNGDAICRLAADALMNGRIGVADPDREILYLSRIARYSGWPGMGAQELADLALHYGETILARTRESARPLYLIKKKPETKDVVNADGTTDHVWVGGGYVLEAAAPKHALTTLHFAAQSAPKPAVRAFLLAGFTARGMTAKQLKAEGFEPELAFIMFDGAVTKFDDPTAWLQSGLLLLEGRGVARDFPEAHRRLVQAWDKGAAKAALYLASMEQHHLVPGATAARSLEWIRRGAEKHEANCMAHWGSYLLAPASAAGLDPTVAEAKTAEGMRWLQQAAEAGSASGMYGLSQAYTTGKGTVADEAKAIAWLRKAVEGGSADAEMRMAERLAAGRGVERDQKAALKLLYTSAQTNLTAANNLGVILWRGEWGEKDVENGLKWMELTLDKGSWITGRNLAKIYHLGLGVEADEGRARHYLERAGAMGGSESARAVAGFYADGEVIAKDLEAAERWKAKAAEPKS